MELKYKDETAIDGSFPSFPNGLLNLLVEARTRGRINKTPSKRTVAFFSKTDSGKKVDKAKELGQPVFTDENARDILGAPLKGYRERFEDMVSAQPDSYINHVLELGDPAPPELLARVEERVGFPLPEAARNLFSELNGLKWFWIAKEIEVDPVEELTYSQAGDSNSEFWTGIHKAAEGKFLYMGLTCIADVEAIFFDEWHLGPDPVDPKAKVKLGKRKVSAPDFYNNLFAFDFFNSFRPCALWADRETEEFYIVYGDDYGAAWDCAPVPLEGYMEALIAQKARDRLMMSGGVKLPHLPYRLLQVFSK